MAFSNLPITEFRVPDNAAPGIPGIEITSTIPAVLAAKYTAASERLVAVVLYYGDAANFYWYDAITTTFRIRGSVVNGVARESFREQYNGPQGMVQWWGYNGSDNATTIFGKGINTTDTTANNEVYFQNCSVDSDANASINWHGFATFFSDFNVQGNSTFDGDFNYTHTKYQTKYAEDYTVLSFTNTGGAAGSPVVGTAFMAPPSGAVEITVGGYVTNNTAGAITHISYAINQDNVVNAGASVVGVDYRNAVSANKGSGSHTRIHSGLTPGSWYNVSTRHWVSPASTGGVEARKILVKPVINFGGA